MSKRTRPTTGLDLQAPEFRTDADRQFYNDIGINAQVERHTIDNDLSAKLSKDLKSVGAQANPLPKDYVYKGSMAVHVYQSKELGQLCFVSQTSPLGSLNQQVAIRALQDLTGSAQEYYGHVRQKLRSGF